MLRALVLALSLGVAGPAVAQDAETLADLRQDLSVLYVEMQRLRQELNTTGAPGVSLSGGPILERMDAIEAELQRLTAKTEKLQFRIDRVVSDGTRRIGDLEFRICDLEPGCQIGELGDTLPLGGAEAAAPAAVPAPAAPPRDNTQLAVGEKDDFNRAKAAFDAGEFQSAAGLFADFAETYTGGALTAEAQYWRGKALDELGQTAAAARAYLAAFSAGPEGDLAPDALLALGRALEALGQTADACITLGEVSNRYPGTQASARASEVRAGMDCF